MISMKTNLLSRSLKRHKAFLLLETCRTVSKFKVYDPREKALSHFDDFYKALFGHRWPSIRLALLSKQKYVAVVNNFGEVEKTEDFLQVQGALNLGSFLVEEKAQYKKSNAESSAQAEQNLKLGEVVKERLKEEERRESSELYSGKWESPSKVEVFSEENEKIKDSQELVYNPKEARSSLHSDLLSSQIDKSRMIEPEEGMMQKNFNEFVPVTHLRGYDDYVPESEYYKYYQIQTDTPITVEKEYDFEFPEKLKVYTFNRGDVTKLPVPTKGILNVYNFLEVEGSDLLTTLALGVQPEDKVLDLCSYSGSMAYCLFQTLRPKILVCVTSGRRSTENTFRGHLFDYSPSWREMLLISHKELHEYEKDELFDKVLINVPSTEDKHSILKTENNIFHIKRLHHRLRLPKLQCSLLLKAMNMVRPGGAVVYSTSSLSPVQNDGVISSALKSAWETSKMKFIVKDLTPALAHTSFFFKFGDFLNMKYGTVVVPFAPSNFGPKYFCKLVKRKE